MAPLDMIDYALAYTIRQEIYSCEGPTTYHESKRFHSMKGRHFLSNAFPYHNLDRVLAKFPMYEPFMEMHLVEVWEKLPALPNVQHEVRDVDTIIYSIAGQKVHDICIQHINS